MANDDDKRPVLILDPLDASTPDKPNFMHASMTAVRGFKVSSTGTLIGAGGPRFRKENGEPSARPSGPEQAPEREAERVPEAQAEAEPHAQVQAEPQVQAQAQAQGERRSAPSAVFAPVSPEAARMIHEERAEAERHGGAPELAERVVSDPREQGAFRGGTLPMVPPIIPGSGVDPRYVPTDPRPRGTGRGEGGRSRGRIAAIASVTGIVVAACVWMVARWALQDEGKAAPQGGAVGATALPPPLPLPLPIPVGENAEEGTRAAAGGSGGETGTGAGAGAGAGGREARPRAGARGGRAPRPVQVIEPAATATAATATATAATAAPSLPLATAQPTAATVFPPKYDMKREP